MSGPSRELYQIQHNESLYSARTAPSRDPIIKVPDTKARRSQPGMDADDIAAELPVAAAPVAEPGLLERAVALLPGTDYTQKLIPNSKRLQKLYQHLLLS